MAQEDNSGTAVLFYMLLFIMIIGTLIGMIYVTIEFSKLKIAETDEKSHTLIMGLLIGQIIVAFLAGVLWVVWVFWSKPERDEGDKPTLSYTFPLTLLSLLSVTFTALNTWIYFIFRKMDVQNKDSSSFGVFSTFIFLAPMTYLMFLIMTIILFIASRMLSSCKKDLKSCKSGSQQFKQQIEKEKELERERMKGARSEQEKQKKKQEESKARKQLEQLSQREQEIKSQRRELERSISGDSQSERNYRLGMLGL